MLFLEGIPIAPGYANGIATVHHCEIEGRRELPGRLLSSTEAESEYNRLDVALEETVRDLASVEQTALSEPRLADTAALLSAHSAKAKEIVALVKRHIGRESVNAEQALDAVIRDSMVRFEWLDNACFHKRGQDVRDVGRRLMRHLAGRPPWTSEPLPPGSVIVTSGLLPSETIEVARSGVVAIVSEHEGEASHTAIVARAFGIPAITGIADVTLQIQPGMRLLVDGTIGSLVIAPPESDEATFDKQRWECEIHATSMAAEDHDGDLGAPAAAELKTVEATPQLAATVIDQRQSLHEMNEALEQCRVDGKRQLSEANQNLQSAANDARLAAVAFDTHDSIIITDQNGQILRVNQSFTKLTGYAPEEVIGKTPRVLRSGRHDEAFYREMWRAIRSEGHWTGEIWNQRKDGHVYLQRLTIACVKDASGETTHYVGNGQDLTRRKQGEADRAAIMAARTVQRSLFPSDAPFVPGFDIAGAVHPAERVSGDFFDYIHLGQNSVGVVVADVSGHGLGPSLLMAKTQAYLHALGESRQDPGELLTHTNRLFGMNSSGNFVTIFLGRIDPGRRSFTYAGAGHQGYLVSVNGEVRQLDSTSVPLGVAGDSVVSSAPEIALETGDTILLPTDGIEEAYRRDRRQFGQQRMFDIIRNHQGHSAAQIVEMLFAEARHFAEGEPQQDDITAVVIKVLHAT